MKKTFKILLFIFTLFYMIPNKNIKAEEEKYNYQQKEEVILENINVDSMYNNETFQVGNEIYIKKYNIIKSGILVDYLETNEYIYIIYKNSDKCYLEQLNTSGETLKKETINQEVKDACVLNKKIYLVGTRYNNATIFIYNENLEQETIYDYGGDGYEEYNHVEVVNDKLYLFGLKDGISHNSVFKNVGNVTDKKSFIVTLDDNYKIDKSLYINYQTSNEIISNIVLNNKIYFMVSTNNDKYQYRINNNLEVEECFKISDFNTNDVIILNNIDMEKYKVYVYQNDNDLYFDVFTNKLEYSYKITNNKENIKLLYIENINGYLDIYYKENNNIIKYSLCEYHIVKKDNKKVEYNDSTYKDVNHFKIESFFTKLEFKYNDELNKNINLSKAKEYNASYIATVDKFEIIVTTPYIVLPYINVINEGIYERGYILNFSDELYINDNIVYPGEVLNQTGLVKVKHVSSGTNEFNIYVEDSYYKDFDINQKHIDIEQSIGSIYQYKLELSEYKEVKNIYVNDTIYPFIQKDNMITIDFKSEESNKIKEYNINYIEYMDGSIYNINEKIKIKTLKKLPVIDIYYMEDMLTYNILDYDKSITDVIIKYYDNNELVKIDKTYLNNFTVNVDEKQYDIEVVLQYEDGSKSYFEESIFQIKASSYIKDKLFEISFDKTEEGLSKINLSVNKSLNLKVLSCEVRNTQLNSFISNDKALNTILISSAITILILLSTGVIILIKKKKTSLN